MGIRTIMQKIGLIQPTEQKATIHISRRYLGASTHGARMAYRR
jgi:hypothetical protein